MSVYSRCTVLLRDGVRTEDYRESLSAGISTALTRLRDCDVDVREGFSQELAQAAEFLDQAAQLAMVAMLKVGCDARCCLCSIDGT